AMLISMTLMGCGILLMALTPGYARIGIAAPLLALTARLLQGFALGGEVGSATAYMLEGADDESRGQAVSWQSISQGIASAIGSLVGWGLSLVLTRLQLDQFGWRIALLLGAAIVPFALLIRNRLPETHDMAVVQSSVAVPFHSYRRVVGLAFLIIAAGTIATYTFRYMATYGQNTIHLSASVAFAGQTANIFIGIFSALLGGWLSDRVGRRWVMIVPQSAFLLAIVPCFLWLTTTRTVTAFIGANLILSMASSTSLGAVYAAITESLPRMVRARAFALVYSVPVALFGGTTQLVVTWLLHVTGNPMAIAWYLTGVTGISLIAMIAMRESAPVKLRQMAPAYQ
ncbi:MAG: MFS transporter, partial [Pseudomonadota bacterium]|nr:MFS transporter [Pseudomonadota bacterium]